MTESPLPSASFTVLGGALDGHKLEVPDSVDEVLVGSDPECRLSLDLPGVSPIHARIWIDDQGAKVVDTRSPRGLYVNDNRVEWEAPLSDGDILWLGTPGEAESVMIQCRFRRAMTPAVAPPQAWDDASTFFEESLTPPESAEPVTAATDDFVVDVVPPSEPPPALPVEDFVVDAEPAVSAPPPVDDSFFVDTEAPAAPSPPAIRTAPASAEEVFFVDETPAVAAAPLPHVPLLAFEPEAPAPLQTQPHPAPSPAPKPSPAAPSAPPEAPKPAEAPKAAARPAAPRAEPAAPSPAPRPAQRREPRSSPPPSRPAPRPRASASPMGRYAAIGVGVIVALGAGGYFVQRSLSTPQLLSLSPSRVRIGDRVTATGKNFAGDAAGNTVSVGSGSAPAVLASATQVQFDVPEVAGPGFRETKVPVKVRVGDRETASVELVVFEAPRIHGVSPDVAMPGEEVSLAGRGWGPGVSVRFGSTNAEVLDTSSTALRVRVPALEGAPGTSFEVVASMGQDASNPAPFMIGRLPLLARIDPPSAAPGDVVSLKGRGFVAEPRDNLVQVGGVHAVLLSATEGELKVVVPRVTATGDLQVQVRVRGLDNLASGTLSVPAPADSVDFHFVAEPFDDVPNHDHAFVSTALGPAFLLAPSDGKSAGQRAVEAAQRLNEAATALKASRDADLELRDPTGSPVIGLTGKPGALLEVSEADAAAFAEDWTKQGGKGPAVSRERLARWWLALGRDLVLLLVRGEKPQYVAATAPAESRVLADVYQAARKTGQFGVPRQVMTEAKAPMRDALRLLALHVPATVAGSQLAAGPTASGPAASVAPLKFEGAWNGSETEGGSRKYITLTIRGAYSTLAYEGAVSMSVPVQVEPAQKTSVRFSLQFRGMRYYSGKWDGERLTGSISSEPGGKGDIGTFELTPGR